MAVFLVARPFRTWTAAYFSLTNFAWFICRSLEVLNRFGPCLRHFLDVPPPKDFVAVWLGSLAVTVRPLIIFLLVGIGILYVLPSATYFGDVLLNVRGSYHATTRQPTRLVPMVIYLHGPSTVLWWER